MPINYDHEHDNEINYFGLTNFRNKLRKFGIKTDDRRRHTYIVGKTGMGKTTIIENMLINDINAGHGVGIVDPHGDMADKILDFIPAHRINDVVVFNPADWEYPVAFNVLEAVSPLHKHLVAQGLMGVFKKIWPDVWSARMEHIMNNCLLALLDYPGSTLLGINRLLVDKAFRKNVINKIRDPIVRAFWIDEFQVWEGKFRTEAIQPIQNKVGQFLSASMIRNIVAQVKSTINPREIMDQGKVFIMNLAKGKLGEDTSRLLGGMLITKMQLAAMERVDTPEPERRDFYLYVDEFQNFATDSFANILSEARKYRLNLTIAHQYIGQLVSETSTRVRDAVFGNVGTLIMFRVGADDAEFLARETEPQFTAEDLVNLPKYQVYLRLMIDGVTSIPFSSTTLAPIAEFQGNREKIVRVSRERHGRPVAEVEDKVMRWAGEDHEAVEAELVREGMIQTQPRLQKEQRGPERERREIDETRRAPVQVRVGRDRGEEAGRRPVPSSAPPVRLEATAPAAVVSPDIKPISLQDALQRQPMKIKGGPGGPGGSFRHDQRPPKFRRGAPSQGQPQGQQRPQPRGDQRQSGGRATDQQKSAPPSFARPPADSGSRTERAQGAQTPAQQGQVQPQKQAEAQPSLRPSGGPSPDRDEGPQPQKVNLPFRSRGQQ